MADRWEDRNRSDFRDDRGYRDREYHERGTLDRARDEVRSWVGDEEAARRRRMDELRDERHDRDWSSRPAYSADRSWERTRDTARDWTDRDRDGRRGPAEWNDSDRPSEVSRPSYTAPGAGTWPGNSASRDSDYYSSRSRAFGDTSRYATAEPLAAPWTAPRTSHEWQGMNYTGRGPRGYQRADERVREDVCDRLTEDPRIDASDVEVHVKGGEVTLAGSVRTREEKRFTEDLVERITGVREVNNSLKVRPPDEVIGTARSGSSVLGLTDTPPTTPRNQR